MGRWASPLSPQLWGPSGQGFPALERRISPPMITLTLIRHAATAWNDDGRYQGRCDPDLSTRGVSQAQALARRLTEHRAGCDSVWASDRRRAWHTAALAVPRSRVRQDARLRELDFGVFEGCTYDDNLAPYPHPFPPCLPDPS